MKKKLNQNELKKIILDLEGELEEMYKPEPSYAIIITEKNREEITNKFKIKKNKETGYDEVVVGSLDEVEYNEEYQDKDGLYKVGVGIMISVSDEGKPDFYPNPHILNKNKFKEIKKKLEPSKELTKIIMDLNIGKEFKSAKTFSKINSVKMLRVSDIKEYLENNGEKIDELIIEATWGIQNNVKDTDWIVATIGDSYKVESEKNGYPEKYREVKELKRKIIPLDIKKEKNKKNIKEN